MTRRRRPGSRFPLIPLMVLLLAAPLYLGATRATAQPAEADSQAILTPLAQQRRSLLDRLHQRDLDDQRLGTSADLLLRLDQGVHHNDLQVVLRHRAGQWRQATAQAPVVFQSTMQEWRGFHLANGAGAAWRPNLRFDVNPAEAALTAQRLAGPLAVRMALDQTLDQMQPPGEVVTWWDRFIPTGLAVPRQQSFTLDARIDPDRRVLDLVLEGGVRWDPASTGKGKPGSPLVVRPIFVRLVVPGSRFDALRVQTPTWNGGFHEGDATGLSLHGDHIRGPLTIMLHQDGWVPFGGGKNRQHPPLVVRFDLDAALKNHQLTGSFKATGDLGTYDGQVRGHGGIAILGRYLAAGDLGEHAGSLDGMLLNEFPALAPPPANDPKAIAPAALPQEINTVLHELRALQLMSQFPALPRDEAWRQTDVAAPIWPSNADPATLAAYCRQALALLSPSLNDAAATATLPTASPESDGDSPSVGATALPADGPVSILPADAPGWRFLSQWQALGPFEQRLGLEHNDARMPEIVPFPGLSYQQEVDRFGAHREDARPVAWQSLATASPRLGVPWEKPGFYTRFLGQLWYAAATLRSEQPRQVWLSLEASDHAKLWVNGTLAWTGTERPWRYREMGRVLVPVRLAAGDNQLLVRVHRDRRPSWFHLALKAQPLAAPATPASPVSIVASRPTVFPDALPPLVWNLDTGLNVAWRNPDLAGNARPVVMGDLLLIASPPHTLVAVDPASGQPRWSADVNVLELLDPAAADAWRNDPSPASQLALLNARKADLGTEWRQLADIRVADPVTDGVLAYLHAGTGVAAAFDARGQRRWMQRTGLTRAVAHVSDGTLVLEGEPNASWPFPDAMRPAGKGKSKPSVLAVLILDAATGEPRARVTLPGSHSPDASQLLRLDTGRLVLLASNGQLIDIAAGKPLGPLDIDYPGPSDETYQAGAQILGPRSGRPFASAPIGNLLAMTCQEQNLAVRFWNTPDGRLAYSHLWQSNYEHTGFGGFTAPAVAAHGLLFSVCPVLERGPHCPDPRLELHVHDLRTGQPRARLKPLLEKAVQHDVAPVVAGAFLFCSDMGGGSHGGNPDHGQIAVVTADTNAQLLHRNLIDLGTRAAPVFAGHRMFLRSPKALTCVAVATEQGRREQSLAIARTLIKDLGAAPRTGSPRQIAPVPDLPLGPTVPVNLLLDGRAGQNWLGAGPCPTGFADDNALASLRPRAGDAFACGQASVTFSPLSRQFAYRDPPLYQGEFTLQGTGEIVPRFAEHVDPAAVSGPKHGEGLLHSVLDNPRDRIVVPAVKGPGLTLWLAGHKLNADEPLRLPPGLYPFTLRVTPEHYQNRQHAILPPVNVAKALDARALQPIGWPSSWKVIGPLPPDAAPLTPEELAQIPHAITRGDLQLPVYDFPVRDGSVHFTALVNLRPGQQPDPVNAPVSTRIAVPASAYALTRIDVPADGILYLTAGADWFMRWHLDGQVIYDTLKDGNGGAGDDPASHPFAVPVTKGPHVIAVMVRPGSKGWSFTSLAGFSDADPATLAPHRVPSKQKVEAPDFRLTPAFREIPHPPTRLQRWLDRVRPRLGLLRELAASLPGTPEAQAIDQLLQAADHP